MEWRANWIWARSHRDTPNFYLYARREFEVHASSSARVFVTCSSEYKLCLNGRYVGRGPGPCHPSYQYFDDYDISHMIRPGRNAVGVICYNQGVDTLSQPGSPGGLLLQAELHNSVETEFLVTDEGWRVCSAEDWDSSSPRISETAGFREFYDSRRKPVAWSIVGHDDSGWEAPELIGPAATEPWKALIPRLIPHLRETEVFAKRIVECGPGEAPDSMKYAKAMLDSSQDSTSIGPCESACVVLDFGAEVVGYPRISVRDGSAAHLEIGYGDEPDSEAMRLPDRVVLHGGRQEWEGFSRREFRYMRLDFRNLAGPVHIESVCANRVGYPVEQVSSFECSDDLLNEIWSAGTGALAVQMQNTYEKCPALDHGQHIADARLQALANYYCFFDTKLAAKALSEFAQSQAESGQIMSIWPSGVGSIVPDHSLLWVQMLHDYHLHTGDGALIESLYPNLHLLLEGWCRAEQDVNGLLSAHDGLSADIISYNALFHQALRDGAKLASAIGRIDDSVEWMARAEIVREAFNERYWSTEQGSYIEDGEPDARANAMGVLCGMANAGQSASIRDEILSDGADWDTPRYDFYVLQALVRLGETRSAIAMMRRKWGEEAARCGEPACAPVYLLSAEVLGVKPSLPGSCVVVVQPRLGDLAWARGTIKTHNSTVSVRWECGQRRFAMEIDAPEGFIAALPIGRFQNPEIQEIDLSPETPERRARRTYGWTDLVWRDGVEHDPYVDWLKSQESEPPDHYRAKKRLFREEEYIWVRESASTHVRYEISESP